MGDSDKAHDIAQMDSSEPPPTSEQPAATIDGLFGTAEAEGDDVFAQLVEVEGDGHEQEQTQPDLVQEPYSETHPPDVPKEAMLDTFQPQKGVKDYSDLLADFEAESDPPGQIQDQSVDQSDAYNHSAILPSEAETDNAADLLGLGQQDEGDLVGDQPKETGHQVTAAHQPSPLPAPALLLQEQSDEPSPIDDLIAQHDTIPQEPTAESMPAESPVPNLSIEHSQHDPGLAGVTDKAASDISMQSLFSNASDWLADTTMDDSFQVNGEHERHTVFAEDKLDRAEDPQEVAPFEVPQGWYDEQGNWQWYTDEEKEQVRLTMLGAGGSMGEEAKIGRPDEHQHGELVVSLLSSSSTTGSPLGTETDAVL